LGPAIDAGAEDIVVVLMAPWEDERDRPRYTPVDGMQGLLMAAQTAFEWALLASFQADLKLFRRTNTIVRLTIENERLRAENGALKARLRGQALPTSYPQADAADSPYREVPSPVVIAPQRPMPLGDIVRYDPGNHERLYRMGYEDARAAWARAGRSVEGG
jgi:hypothetical protein